MINNRAKPNRNINTTLNENIKYSYVLVIDDIGNKLGPIPLSEAVKMAKSKGMDLLLVSNNPKNPVTKILDYGKHKYDLKKQNKENKKKQTVILNREMRLRTGTGDHDIAFKVKKVRKFLEEGSRVKISLKFRGREVTHVELGHNMLKKFYNQISDIADIEKPAKLSNLFLDMYVAPKKKTNKK